MKYQAVLFDMDGTLLDTLEDLQDGVNVVLEKRGYPQHTLEEIREYVGNGAGVLIRRALPEGTSEAEISEVLAEYKEWYRIHYCTKTHPYPGVPELLEKLAAAGVKMAVVSNKPDAVTKELAKKFFPGLPAFGQRDDVPRKPEPQMAWNALETLGVGREQACYVGDSEVDVATAKNAGLPAVIVSWGFRTEEQLRIAGAEIIAATTAELLAQLD